MTDKEKRIFRYGLIFAASVILIFFIITNIETLGRWFLSLFSLFLPLIIGILIALILYKPMNGLCRLCFRWKRKGLEKRSQQPAAAGKKNGRRAKKGDTQTEGKRPALFPLSDRVITLLCLTLTYILALLVLIFVGKIVVPKVVTSFRGIVSSVQGNYPKALTYLESKGIDTAGIEKFIRDIDFLTVWKTVTDNAGLIFSTAMGAVTGIFSVLAAIFTAVVFSIYLLANVRTLKRQAGRLLDAYCKPKMGAAIRRVGMLTVRSFMNFFSGQCVEACILGTIFFVTLTILRIPYAVVISVVIAFTAMVPYVGSFIGCAVGVVLILMDSPMKALFFVAVFLIIQQLENNLIYPRVVGTSINLPAMWTFVAVIAGGATFGVLGMLFFIPIFSVLYALLRDGTARRLAGKKKAAEEAAADPPSDTENI